MTPTLEEVKRVAIECGMFRPDGTLMTVRADVLQAFAQHYIEVGRNGSQNIPLESLLRIRDAIVACDGVVNIVTLDDIYEEATAGILAYSESCAIRNNTGE